MKGTSRSQGQNNISGRKGIRPTDLAAEDSEDDASSVEGGAGSDGPRDMPKYVTPDGPEADEEIWNADRSCVVGLQKRGLRGLMEGRRIRERGRSVGVGGQSHSEG